jgi:short-subunit dehydrogenase
MPGLDLAGRTALLTGATGGIGRAIADALFARGARLVLSGRREDELERVAAEFPGARTLVADLAQRADVARLCEQAVAAEVDVLIANAALPAMGVLAELDQAEIDGMLDVNLRAPIVLAKALVPQMAARRRGHLVFISSLSGKTASPASSMYSATKFGLRGFALGLREDMRNDGVGVSVITPGFISDAGMFVKTGVKLPAGVGTRSPQQVADAVARAIERDRAEVDVAPVGLRIGTAFASVAPGPAATISRLLGSHRIAEEMARSR